jgi:hypothetical protein
MAASTSSPTHLCARCSDCVELWRLSGWSTRRRRSSAPFLKRKDRIVLRSRDRERLQDHWGTADIRLRQMRGLRQGGRYSAVSPVIRQHGRGQVNLYSSIRFPRSRKAIGIVRSREMRMGRCAGALCVGMNVDMRALEENQDEPHAAEDPCKPLALSEH